MKKQTNYSLPELDYDYNSLEPYISKELLHIHHDFHHASYVKNANNLLQMLEVSKIDNIDFNPKMIAKDLSFYIGGHILHSLFWKNMAPANEGGGGNPSGKIVQILTDEFGSIERFKKILSQTAVNAEGSAWAALAYCKELNRPIIMQIEKHNVNLIPTFDLLLVLDVWEHAFYIDYKNEKDKFVKVFWNIINWEEINKRVEFL